MKTTVILGLSLSLVFISCHCAVNEESYEELLASIHNIPFPESDGTPFPVNYDGGRKKTYTRGILDSFVNTLSDTYKTVVNTFGFDVSYKTDSGTEVESKTVILNKGTDKEELAAVGAYSYNEGDTIVTNMWTAGRDGYKSHVLIKNRKAIMPKAVQSLLAG